MSTRFSRRRLWLMLAVAAVTFLGVLAYFLFCGPIRLAAFKAEMISQGEVLDLKNVIPKHPPENENAAPLLDASINMLGTLSAFPEAFASMKFVAPGKARISWKLDESISDDGQVSTWSECQKQWEYKQTQLARLHSILVLPHLDRHLEYERGFNLLLPQLAKNKAAVQWLRLAISCQLRQTNLEGASAAICDLLRFTRLQSEEPLLIAQLVFISEFLLAIGPLWEALQIDGWNDSHLAAIQNELEKIEFFAPMKRTLMVERAMTIQEYAKYRRSMAYATGQLMGPFGIFPTGGGANPGATIGNSKVSEDFSHLFQIIGGWMQSAGMRTAYSTRFLYWRYFRSYDDEIEFLKCHGYIFQQLSKLENGKPMHIIDAELKTWFEEKQTSSRKFMLAHLMLINRASYIERVAFAESMKQMAIAALAIHRYKVQNHHLPSTLDQLVPVFLKKTPWDPVSGQSLRYKITHEDRMLLYSIGQDAVDNDGDPTPGENLLATSIFNGKDWVWPEPASPEEVNSARDQIRKRPQPPKLQGYF